MKGLSFVLLSERFSADKNTLNLDSLLTLETRGLDHIHTHTHTSAARNVSLSFISDFEKGVYTFNIINLCSVLDFFRVKFPF